MTRLAAVAATLAVILLAVACDDEKEPSPGLAPKYDVVIAVCGERLPEVTALCDRITSSSADRAYANVIFGRAGGREVTVRTETVSGGDAVDESPANRVPEGRSWLHVVQLERQAACTDPECELKITAVVDGRDVSNERFRFTAP